MSSRSFVVAALVGTFGCSGDGLVSDQGSPAGTPTTPSSAPAPSSSPTPSHFRILTSCPRYTGVPGLERACMFDSNGKIYAEDGTLYAFPAAPPYGAMFVFAADAMPAAADVTTTAGGSIGVYAAPYVVTGPGPCCSEDNEANRIPADATIDAAGVLTISAPNPVPVGYQISIILDFGKLYRSRITPFEGTCDLPGSMCTYGNSMGFAMRFYVGKFPSGGEPPVRGPVTAPDGACLLSYNTALVAEGADDCCYRKGGANTCDTTVACNDRSGAGCCLIYGTENTQAGGRCCLYANGGNVDGADECDQLLASGR